MIRNLKRLFRSAKIEASTPLKIKINPTRFSDWKDASAYLGKPIRACLVEEPDIIGILTGIEINEHPIYITDKSEAMLTIWSTNLGGTYRYPYWKCKPD